MVDTVLNMGSTGRSGPTTINRWDLKAQDQFPQWELDTRRAIRTVAPPGFLKSSRPAAKTVKPDAGVKRSKAKQDEADAILRKVQEQWDLINLKVYEIIKERVALCEADVNTVRGMFGDLAKAPYRAYDGVNFWKWINGHRNISMESTQLQLDKRIKDLWVGPTASAEDVATTLLLIETD